MRVWADERTWAAAFVSLNSPLSTDDSLEAMSLYKTWYNDCLTLDEDCKRTVSGREVDEMTGPELPTRVLDLGKTTAKDLILLESKGLRGQYCALSYCWGPPNTQTFLTTKGSLQDRLDGIDFEHLPKAFQDAVQITRALGFRYLWVDGLCIIQGDEQDWQSEAEKMGTVYENASLVIAASASTNVHQGCFAKSRPWNQAVLDLPYYSATGDRRGLIHASILRTTEVPLSDCPLRKRGWTLQEAHFARRTINFTSVGPVWCCKENQYDEANHGVELEFYKEWDHILQEYSRRQHTYKSDRLIALRGYAMELQKKTGDLYKWGYFQSELPGQLLWSIDERAPNSEDIVEIPSWAWASKGGEKVFWTTQSMELQTVIDHRSIHITESGVLSLKSKTITCYSADTNFEHGFKPNAIFPGLQNIYGILSGFNGRRQPLLRFAESPHSSNQRMQAVAIFDGGHCGIMQFLPLMTTTAADCRNQINLFQLNVEDLPYDEALYVGADPSD
ncbi:uncharacterized protein PG986_007732 [Apiospora aurea]|uniref:Heterokaryon incompatibility domain-containing protein n=1 Tax=Apiospora aurea TaxID=335848 RepID=A0ABR1QDN9_9PEZI